MATSATATALTQAHQLLSTRKDEAALAKLLVAWRERRSPRIADLVDRVSDRITEARGPVRGKTVKERTAAWLAIAAKKDAADLGRLLATPWPGTWQDALPVLEAVVEFPDDPRLAVAFAKLIDATQYDTWTSK